MAAEDITVLIPQVRRAVDGPAATSAASPSTSLDDEQIKGLIADAVGEIILLTGGLFGHELVVTDRDDTYGAPTAWEVDPALKEPEKVVIASQAALNFFFHKLRDLKVAETLRDEASEWSYQLSSNLIRDQMAYLRSTRDAALEQVAAENPVPIAYVSFIAQRDSLAAAYIEPWPLPGYLMP